MLKSKKSVFQKKIEENNNLPVKPSPVVAPAPVPIPVPVPVPVQTSAPATTTTTTTTTTTSTTAVNTKPKTNPNATKKLLREGDSSSDEDESSASPSPQPDKKDAPKNLLTEEQRKAIQNRLEELKDEIVNWKKAWVKVKGKKPEKADIPKPIKEKMKHYKELEKQLL